MAKFLSKSLKFLLKTHTCGSEEFEKSPENSSETGRKAFFETV